MARALHTLKLKLAKKKHSSSSILVNRAVSEHLAPGIGLCHTILKVYKVEVELADGSTVKTKHKGKFAVGLEVRTMKIGKVSFLGSNGTYFHVVL